MPIEPPLSPWEFPPAEQADDQDVVGVGADLQPGTLLLAYRSGIFPMPAGRRGPMAWWSPDPRAILPLDALQVSRSLRRSLRRYEVRIDTAFEAVVDECADESRPHGWITPEIRAAYVRLHQLGWAHSIETWEVDEPAASHGGERPIAGASAAELAGGDRLVGGLYGVAIGGLFAGESMFHHRTDASKVALVGLVDLLRSGADGGAGRVLDVQWLTPHLASLGAIEVPRLAYLEQLRTALELDLPEAFDDRDPAG